MNFLFFTNAILLGVGLAMDAFSVSLANGLNESHMGKKRQFQIAGCFSIFQTIMPLIGWFCVHTLVDTFTVFQKFIPYIALILLLFIGSNMILESFKKDDDKEDNNESLSLYGLIIQGSYINRRPISWFYYRQLCISFSHNRIYNHWHRYFLYLHVWINTWQKVWIKIS